MPHTQSLTPSPLQLKFWIVQPYVCGHARVASSSQAMRTFCLQGAGRPVRQSTYPHRVHANDTLLIEIFAYSEPFKFARLAGWVSAKEFYINCNSRYTCSSTKKARSLSMVVLQASDGSCVFFVAAWAVHWFVNFILVPAAAPSVPFSPSGAFSP